MIIKSFFIFVAFVIMTSCDNKGQHKVHSDTDSITTIQNSLINNEKNKPETIEIHCDSIFKNKGITIKLISIDTNSVNTPNYEVVFLVVKQQNGQYFEIFKDTIISRFQEIRFADFNNDNVKDILIQNISDVRSNWTYSLYLVDKDVRVLKKIKGFENIKNPNYLPQYDLIDNMVMSGQHWTNFYKIMGDTIKDFNMQIYTGADENGNVTYEANYKKAINKLTNLKNSH